VSALPTPESAEIRDRSGTVLETVRVRIWRDGDSAPSPQSQVYPFRGVATREAAPHLVGKQNMRLVTDEDTYAVTDAINHPIMGIVELALLRARPDG